MKKLLLIPLVLLLCSCMTANQLEAEKAYYQMLTAKQAQTTPLVRLDVADPAKPINLKTIEVFAPPSNTPVAQYQQRDYVGPWLRVVSAALPWIGVWGVAHEMGKAAGDTISNYNQTVSGTGNSASVKTSAMSTGAMGDGNSLTGMSEVQDSYNPTTTTTTTSTDDHSTDDHSVPLEE